MLSNPDFNDCVLLLFFFLEGPAVVDVNLMFRGFPTISDNKMVSKIRTFYVNEKSFFFRSHRFNWINGSNQIGWWGKKFLDDGVAKKLGPTPGIDLKGHISRWMKTSGWARKEKEKEKKKKEKTIYTHGNVLFSFVSLSFSPSWGCRW